MQSESGQKVQGSVMAKLRISTVLLVEQHLKPGITFASQRHNTS